MKNSIHFILLFLTGCTHLVKPPSIEEVPRPRAISYEFSEDGKTITLRVPRGAVAVGDTIHRLLSKSRGRIRYAKYFSQVEDDSLKNVLTQELKEIARRDALPDYSFRDIRSDNREITITLKEDESRIALMALELIGGREIAAREDLVPHDFSYFRDISFLLPCPNVRVPEESYLLPNAPRSYRSGTHRGIDFPTPYGAEVRSIADGIVIRADHDYREVTDEFRESLLQKASTLGRTPSDVFEHILLGKSVFIDHEFEIIPGKRLVSTYGHLSQIDDKIQVGLRVKRGQLLGLSGNSGTSDGAKGKRTGAHLHFEITVQDKDGERYLGQGMEYEELYNLLTAVFE